MDRSHQLIAGSVFASGATFLLACALVIEPYGFTSRITSPPGRVWCAPDTTGPVRDLSLLKQLLATTKPVSASGITYGF
jgi:hypothetical protein